MEESTPYTAIRIEAARDQLGGCDDSVLTQLATALLSESSARIQEMHGAIEQDDTAAIGRAAHAFKGAAALFGADDLLQRLLQIESDSREQNMPAIVEQFPHLKVAVEQVQRELEQFVGENPTPS